MATRIILSLLVCIHAVALHAVAQITNVSIGSNPNDGAGDTLRAAFSKLNTNVAWLAGQLGSATNSPNFTTNATVAGADVATKVANVAALKAIVPKQDGMRIDTLGYYSAGDGGGASYYFSASSTATADNGSVIQPNSGPGRFLLLYDGTNVKASWFGAIAGDGLSDSSQIQAAMDYVYSLKRGTVQLDGGRYDISATLKVPYRVNLRGADGWKLGEFAASISTNVLFLTGGPTMLRLGDSANVDILWLDSTDGFIRQPSEVLEDGEIVDSRFQDSTIENIVFFGNAANQTKYNLRGIAAKSKWTGSIQNCGFVYISGFAIWLFDCNAFVVDNIWMSCGSLSTFGKGMFVYSSADNFFGRIYGGGSRGPVVWENGSSTFKNVHREWILFNAVQTNTLNSVSSWTSNSVANFAGSIPIETGEPVEMRTDGSLPIGFTDTQLYFAVKLSATQYGFHTNYALATNGAYLSGTGAASGASYITTGPATSLYISGQAGQNVYNGLRADQNSGPGIIFRDAVGNYVSGLEAGENNGVQNGEVVSGDLKAGVLFDKNSERNDVEGTIYSQNIGFNVRSNATANIMNAVQTSVLTNVVNSSSGVNFQQVNQNLSGTATWGVSSTATALDLTGNSGGQRIIKMSRTSGLTQSIGLGVGSSALNVWNETLSRGIALLSNDGTTASIQIGDASASSPPASEIYGTAGSGSNIAGSAIRFYADRSTGNADATDAYLFLTGDTGSSGSSAQSMTTKFAIEGDGDVRIVSGLTVNSNGVKVNRLRHGRATLVAGSVTVSDAYVTTNTRILLSVYTPGGTLGFLSTGTRSAGVSFTITSTSATDTSVVDWVSFEP